MSDLLQMLGLVVSALTGAAGAYLAARRHSRAADARDRRDAVAAMDGVVEHYQEIVVRLEDEVARLRDEVARLRVHVDTLERELGQERRDRISGSTDITIQTGGHK